MTAAAGIWHGIRAMVRANKDRTGILDRQRDADERRHIETMQALADEGGATKADVVRPEAKIETGLAGLKADVLKGAISIVAALVIAVGVHVFGSAQAAP